MLFEGFSNLHAMKIPDGPPTPVLAAIKMLLVVPPPSLAGSVAHPNACGHGKRERGQRARYRGL